MFLFSNCIVFEQDVRAIVSFYNVYYNMLIVRLENSSLVKKKQSQVALFAASIKAIYLASIDNKATISCFFKYQLTGSSLNIKIKPNIDL